MNALCITPRLRAHRFSCAGECCNMGRDFIHPEVFLEILVPVIIVGCISYDIGSVSPAWFAARARGIDFTRVRKRRTRFRERLDGTGGSRGRARLHRRFPEGATGPGPGLVHERLSLDRRSGLRHRGARRDIAGVSRISRRTRNGEHGGRAARRITACPWRSARPSRCSSPP